MLKSHYVATQEQRLNGLSDFHKTLYRSFYTKHCLSEFVFVKNKAVTLIMHFTVYVYVYLYFPYFLTHLGEILYTRSPSNATEKWPVSLKLE